jgi:hypothetical protein
LIFDFSLNLFFSQEYDKTYSRGDIVMVVKCLAEEDRGLLHPLFLAQFPLLLWPIMRMFGSFSALYDFLPQDYPQLLSRSEPVVFEPWKSLIGVSKIYKCAYEGCNEFGTLMCCGNCKLVRYCSAEHQKEDYPSHKGDCKDAIAKKNMNKKPSSKSKPTTGGAKKSKSNNKNQKKGNKKKK